MSYVDGDTGQEISEIELLGIVADEINVALDRRTTRLKNESVFDDGLSYDDDKYICENLGFYDAETDEVGVIRIPLDSSISDSNHERIIVRAKECIESWTTLRRAIFHHAQNAWPMAKPYWDLLEDLIFDRVIDAPKQGKYKKTELDYMAYLIAAKKISKRFGIKLTRNDDSDTTSAIDLIAQSVGLSYATLKKESYIRYHR